MLEMNECPNTFRGRKFAKKFKKKKRLKILVTAEILTKCFAIVVIVWEVY